MVDGREVKNIESAIRPETRIIFLESPNSWTFEQQDIQAIADIARKNNILSIIDNSYASPLYQNPIGMGIDMVTHSATKYLSGHSDAVAGVLCGSKEMMKNIFASEFMTIGAVISPFNAWLLLRGLRTLPIRMEKVSRSTPEIVAFLEQHPKVAKVYYPYSESDPQYELSIKQMCKPAGQFSIQLKTESKEEVEKFCNRLKRFLMACSWGGYESLIFPAIVLYTSENYQNKDLSWDLVRFYIGLEEPEVLIEDIKQALEGMQ